MTEKRSFVIGADIGGTYLRIGGVDQDNRLVCFQKVPVGEVFSSGDALLDLKNYLLKYIRQPEFEGEIKAIGMGFPATLNRERTVVVQAPNIPYMENLPITDYLQKELSFPVSYLTEKIYEYTRKPYPAASLSLIFSKEEKTKTVSGAASYDRRQISE